MTYCVLLKDAENTDDVGGKAEALGRMLRANIPVPKGFCITTSAYKQHILAADFELEDLSIIRQAILQTSIPLDVKQAISQSWFQCGWQDKEDLVLAVRSSATAEDSNTASFAGQYETYLHVKGFDQVLEKIKLCWASTWSEHAYAYAERQEMMSGIFMAVVVQEMIEADAAGVAFTAEPVTGNPHVMYVEGITGIGEPLVSGDKNPDIRAWIDHSYNLLRLDVLSNPSPIPTAYLSELARLLIDVEQFFGKPQDIEWVWERDQGFKVVQARPITTLLKGTAEPEVEPWLLSGIPEEGWTESQHTLFDFWDEYNPRSIMPLDWDLYESTFWEANLKMFDFIENFPHVEQISILHEGVVIGVDPAGRCNHQNSIPIRVKTSPITDWDAAMQRWKREADDLMIKLTSIAESLSYLDSRQLLSFIEEAALLFRNAFCERMLNINQWIDQIEASEEVIRNILSLSIGKDEIENMMVDLTSSIEHETALMNKKLWELMLAVSQDATLIENPIFQQQVNRFIEEFGHFEVEKVPISVNPENIWLQLRSIADSNVMEIEPELQSKQRFDSRVSALRKVLSSSDWRTLEDSLVNMRNWIRIRESSKTSQNFVFPLLIQLVQEAGVRIQSQGLIENSGDVKFLRYAELSQTLLAENLSLDSKKLLKRKKLVEWKKSQSWLPKGFLGDDIDPNQALILGEAGSAGCVQGIARVVNGIEDFNTVQPGDIVVTFSTNPAWTQLFNRIAGIIVEQGGKISHAAVTAREYQIPAVLGIRGITKVIKTGELLFLDGGRGEIKRINSESLRDS